MPTAITYARFGGPEVLEVSEVEAPVPGPGQVRVRVRAAGVNPVDVKIRRGDFGGGGFPRTAGLDLAGVVDALGDGALGVATGDEVLGVAVGGAYAEYALMERTFAKPAGVSWETAAGLPTIGEAAFRTLGHLAVAPGETLLVHGAAGSVGGVATQLAVARGVMVVGSVAERDDEYLRSLGAVPVRYGDGLVARVRAVAPHGVDAVLDAAGRGALPDSITLAGGTGRVVTIADPRAAELGVRFSGGDPADRAWEGLSELLLMAAAGALHLPIWRTYPLAQAATAHADVEAGANRGKIVLLPEGPWPQR